MKGCGERNGHQQDTRKSCIFLVITNKTNTKMKKFIGFSLSFCMQDLLLGCIKLEEISAIVTSTALKTIEDMMEAYYTSYWKEYATPERCQAMLAAAWPIICQPRLQVGFQSHRGHYTAQAFWFNTQTGELHKHLPLPEKEFYIYHPEDGNVNTELEFGLTYEHVATVKAKDLNDAFAKAQNYCISHNYDILGIRSTSIICTSDMELYLVMPVGFMHLCEAEGLLIKKE